MRSKFGQRHNGAGVCVGRALDGDFQAIIVAVPGGLLHLP